MGEQDRFGSSADRADRKFVILEIEDETPDFSGGRENAGGFSNIRTEMAEENSIFEFEITEDFWREAEAFQREGAREKALEVSPEAPGELREQNRVSEAQNVPAEADIGPEEAAPEEDSLDSTEESEAPEISDAQSLEFRDAREQDEGTEPETSVEEAPHDPFSDFRLETQPEFLFDYTQPPEKEAIYTEPEEPPKQSRRILRGIASWTMTVIVAFTLALLINIFVFRPSEVSGESMVPTLHNTDTVILSRIPYIFGEPDHGDIVVIDSHVNDKRSFFTLFEEAMKYNVITKLCGQEEPDYFWIKRVIGVAGDEISFSENQIYRNGELLEEDYINESFIYTYPNGISLTVPEGYVYVMGDNRNHSTDSRVIGVVPLENIIGKMIASW